ncbi:glycoside hydrolase superfamily [Chytriomyces sp. MP71]|nr:glycoside hydrolase superfamily [Chytriomyces sp. MP71]
MFFSTTVALLAACLAVSSRAQKAPIPPDGKVVFGVWFDGTSATSDVSGNDTAAQVNQRLGFNVGAFQAWQSLPLKSPKAGVAPLSNPDGSFNFEAMFDDGTNAAIFLTIYPDELDVPDAEILKLAQQCSSLAASTGRAIYLRFGAEMNGDWFVFGHKPAPFVALWKRAYAIFQKEAPQVAWVWSPNFNGPYNNYPYTEYWPGADVVDWVGISLYWKGWTKDWPWHNNTLGPADYVAQVIDAQGPEGGPTSIYREYAVKYNKPFVISECGAAFVLSVVADANSTSVSPVDPGPGRTAIAMRFWNGFLFNQTFLAQYPLLKMVFQFEIFKLEDNANRDYRVSYDSDTVAAFQDGLKTMDKAGVFVWADKAVSSVTTTSAVATTGKASVVSTGAPASSKSGAMGLMNRAVAIGTAISILFI